VKAMDVSESPLEMIRFQTARFEGKHMQACASTIKTWPANARTLRGPDATLAGLT